MAFLHRNDAVSPILCGPNTLAIPVTGVKEAELKTGKLTEGRDFNALGYMPQLDSLRWFAVLGVFISHSVWASEAVDAPWPGHAIATLPLGWVGVRLFFVLSGFLITGILLSCREQIDRGELSPWWAARNFYIRRFLRLFPVYYAYLAVGLVLMPESREYIGWFFTYMQNILFARRPDVEGIVHGHFWSLAVEEQFYLTWPWIMLFLRRRWLVWAAIAMVASGSIFRIAGMGLGYEFLSVRMWTPANFDTLGMGCLLAVLQGNGGQGRRHGEWLMRAGLYVGMPVFLLDLAYLAGWFGVPAGYLQVTQWANRAVGDTFCGLAFVWLVGRASEGFTGAAGAFLRFPVFVYLGKISYGLYIFHFSLPGLFREVILPRLGIELQADAHSWRMAPVYAVFWIAVAMASWHLYEAPLNRLKRYFPYGQSRARAKVPVPT